MDQFDQDEIEQIAIIGMAGRFPQAESLDEFWQNLREGKESVCQFSDEELRKQGVKEADFEHPDYVKSGVLLDNIDLFDAGFFGYNAKEAEIIDPQQRIFLETAWEALENAGCQTENYKGAIGVFGGTGGNDYRKMFDIRPNNITSGFESFQEMIGNDVDYLTTRIAYKLNLRGPCLTVQTACSTSLVAVHVACQHLLTYQCDVALAGGVSIRLPQGIGYRYQDGLILSPDGHCRAFDANAKGTILGSGAGVVVLKRLSEAIEECDHIYAVIKGSAINNDGADKIGYTAPSVGGQTDVISMAQEVSSISPETITYVETHGTGTILGDPIEIEALTEAFRLKTTATKFCAIGSVKTNIGHLDSAAGIAGLIKTVLAIKHKEIPPLLHFDKPNPNIDFKSSPFYVNRQLTSWECPNGKRRAGVSSFGIGGTNAHVILEEAPQIKESNISRRLHLLPLSAKSEKSLSLAAHRMSTFLKKNPNLSIANISYTLQVGRKDFKHRHTIVVESIDDAIKNLDEKPIPPKNISVLDNIDSNVVFMFSGQGSQFQNMGFGLYEEEPVFRDIVDYCSELLKPLLKIDLKDILFPLSKFEETANQLIGETYITQPALFVIEYGLAKLWESWGITPKAMVGHSIGEYVAACIAGVFTLDDALKLVAVRGRMMYDLDRGDMIAVPLSEEDVLSLLPSELSLAAINAPKMVAISGNNKDISTFKKLLEKKELECIRLQTSHAFHSQMMDPIIDRFSHKVSEINLNVPQIPFVSNVSGTWITNEEATSPKYWAKHMRLPVRFFPCINTLISDNKRIFVEVGPGQVLINLAKRHPESKKCFWIPTMRRFVEQKDDLQVVLTSLGMLWNLGVRTDWRLFWDKQTPQKVPLPTYPFEKESFWSNNIPFYNACSSAKTKTKDHLEAKSRLKVLHKTDQERFVAEKIKKTLREISGIDIEDLNDLSEFGEFGLDSIHMAQLASILSDYFNVQVLFRQLVYDLPNIKDLIEYICTKIEKNNLYLKPSKYQQTQFKNLVIFNQKGDRLPFVFVHGDEANSFLLKKFDEEQPFFGYVHQGADGERIQYKKVKDIAKHYLEELRAVKPEGPYILGGFSFGGLIAYEMASQLSKRGKEVSLLVMIDTCHPAYFQQRKKIKTLRNLARFFLDIPKNFSKYYWSRVVCQYYFFRGRPLPTRHRNEYILSTYDRFAIQYSPKVLNCRVALFRATDNFFDDPTNGWSTYSQQEIEVQRIPGDHLSMVRDSKNFIVLTDYLMSYIDAANEA